MNETTLATIVILLVSVIGAFIYGGKYSKFKFFKKIADAQETKKKETKKALDEVNKKYEKLKTDPSIIDLTNVVRKRLSDSPDNGKAK